MPGEEYPPAPGTYPRPDSLCPLCHRLMKAPVRIQGCAHRFCDTCLQAELSEGDFRCPLDGSSLDYAQIYPDQELERFIQTAIVSCKYNREGCTWTGPLSRSKMHSDACPWVPAPCPNRCKAFLPRAKLQDHIEYACPLRMLVCHTCANRFTAEALESHEGNCPLEIVWCENKCGARLQNRYLSNHMKNECHKRVTRCQYCSKEFVHETLQDHHHLCPRFPVTCPNRCEVVRLAREEVQSHVVDSCPSTPISCPFKRHGCKHVCSRQSLLRHMEESATRHVTLLAEVVTAQDRKLAEMSRELELLRCCEGYKGGGYVWRVEGVGAMLAAGREVHGPAFYTGPRGYRLQASLTVTPASPGGTYTGGTSPAENRGSSGDYPGQGAGNRAGAGSRSPAEGGYRSSRGSSGSGGEGSPGEYTGHGPYYRGGSGGEGSPGVSHSPGSISGSSRGSGGSGEGNTAHAHLSVHIRVLAGEYDGILDWPFRLPVAVRLLDQSDDHVTRRHRSATFTPHPSRQPLHRPSPPKPERYHGNSHVNPLPTPNINPRTPKFGLPRFISLESLKTGSYVRDDVMFLEIRILDNRIMDPSLNYSR